MKKFFSILLVVLSFSLLAACGGEETPELVIASVYASEVAEQELYEEELFAPFEEEHGVTIRFEQLESSDVQDKLEVERDSEEYTVDLVIEHFGNMVTYLDEGYMQDISDLESSMDDRTFIDAFDTNTHMDGDRYFFPVNADVYITIANADAFDDLPTGLSEEDILAGDYTWDDYVAWGNNLEGTKVFMKAAPENQLTYQIGGMALSHGGEYPVMNDSGNVAAWQDVIDMKDSIHPESKNNASATQLMGDNSTFLAFEHMAVVSTIYTAAPAKYEVFPGPEGSSGKAGSIAAGHGIGIVENAPNQDLAEDFIEFVTSPEKSRHLALGTIPTIEEAELGEGAEDEVLEIALSTIANANVEGLQMIGDYSDWSSVKAVYDSVYDGIMDESITSSNLRDELDDMQDDLDDLLVD